VSKTSVAKAKFVLAADGVNLEAEKFRGST